MIMVTPEIMQLSLHNNIEETFFRHYNAKSWDEVRVKAKAIKRKQMIRTIILLTLGCVLIAASVMRIIHSIG
jgi:type IV secretory pathway component VirB8